MSAFHPKLSRGAVEGTVLAAALFVVYALGACPTIYVGDSGELVAAVHTLGIPHPSGYPLYVLLGKLWTLAVPVGSIAYRMSLFSAACAGAACGCLHVLGRRLGLHPVAAATSALLLGVSPSFWGEANVQRVYALNALFVVLVTSAALSWHRSRRDRDLFLAFFLCGLGATNHTFMGVMAAAVAVFAAVSDLALLRRPRAAAGIALAFTCGLLPYAYLPLRSRMDPRLDWGNPETLSALVDVILRRDFWGRAWIEGPADLVPIAADYLRGLGEELLWVGAALALVGLVAGLRRGWPVLLPALVMAVNAAAVGLHGSRTDIFVWHRYDIPSYVMAALLAGIGCHVAIERWPGLRAAILVPLAVLVLRYPDFNRSHYRIAEDFSRKLLETLPPGAHVAASDDNILFVLIYLNLVEGLRPDVDLILQGVGEADLPPLRFNPDNEALFFTHHPNWRHPDLQVVPVGLAFQVVRTGRPRPPALVPKGPLEGSRDPSVPKDYLTQNLIGHFHYMLGSTFEGLDWPRTFREFAEAARTAPRNDVLFYNLGLIYARNGLHDEALAAFERSHELNPRHIATEGRVRAADRVAEERAEVERLGGIESRLGSDLPSSPPAAYHRLLAERLAASGETLAARGHGLRALMADADRVSR